MVEALVQEMAHRNALLWRYPVTPAPPLIRVEKIYPVGPQSINDRKDSPNFPPMAADRLVQIAPPHHDDWMKVVVEPRLRHPKIAIRTVLPIKLEPIPVAPPYNHELNRIDGRVMGHVGDQSTMNREQSDDILSDIDDQGGMIPEPAQEDDGGFVGDDTMEDWTGVDRRLSIPNHDDDEFVAEMVALQHRQIAIKSRLVDPNRIGVDAGLSRSTPVFTTFNNASIPTEEVNFKEKLQGLSGEGRQMHISAMVARLQRMVDPRQLLLSHHPTNQCTNLDTSSLLKEMSAPIVGRYYVDIDACLAVIGGYQALGIVIPNDIALRLYRFTTGL